MAAKKDEQEPEEGVKFEFRPVRPRTPEMANLLSAGYQMTVEEAQSIVAARKQDSTTYSIAEVRKAEALLAAYSATPKVVARRPMWKRPALA
jgi:hypothetical protein